MRARRGFVHARLGPSVEIAVVASQQGNQGMPRGEQLFDPMQAKVKAVNDGGDTTYGGKKKRLKTPLLVWLIRRVARKLLLLCRPVRVISMLLPLPW